MDQTQASESTAQDLPFEARTRRLSMTILTNRAIAQKRERELLEVLGDEGAYLCSELVGCSTSEVAAQLLLTEHLLERGWSFPEILRAVWYREEALRTAVRD